MEANILTEAVTINHLQNIFVRNKLTITVYSRICQLTLSKHEVDRMKNFLKTSFSY